MKSWMTMTSKSNKSDMSYDRIMVEVVTE